MWAFRQTQWAFLRLSWARRRRMAFRERRSPVGRSVRWLVNLLLPCGDCEGEKNGLTTAADAELPWS